MGATDAHASETYTVEAGDTLSKISHKFAGNDSLVEAIAKANKISNVNMIFAGQELTIDSEGKAAKEEKHKQLKLFKKQQQFKLPQKYLHKKRHQYKQQQLLYNKHKQLLFNKQRQYKKQLQQRLQRQLLQQKNGLLNVNQAVLIQLLTVNTSDVTNYQLHT